MMNARQRELVFCELRKFYDRDDAEIWLELPHPQLKGRRPTDCEFEEVMAILDRLGSGAYL